MDLLQFLKDRVDAAKDNPEANRYRLDLLKALINSYPPETPIKIKEIHNLMGYRIDPRFNTAYSFLKRQIERGEIERITRSGMFPAYRVLKPGYTYDRERQIEQLRQAPAKQTSFTSVIPPHNEIDIDEPTDEEFDKMEVTTSPNLEETKTYTFEELENIAIKLEFYSGQRPLVADLLTYLKKENS